MILLTGTFANKATVGDGKAADSTSAPATLSITEPTDVVKIRLMAYYKKVK